MHTYIHRKLRTVEQKNMGLEKRAVSNSAASMVYFKTNNFVYYFQINYKIVKIVPMLVLNLKTRYSSHRLPQNSCLFID